MRLQLILRRILTDIIRKCTFAVRAVFVVMNCSHNTAIVLTMRIVSHFLEKVKDGIHIITGLEPPACPDCGQIMEPHGRCRRYVRMPGGIRHTLSLRVFHCSKCRHYHRELPDFITPRKHLCTEVIAAIYDNLDNYDVDNRRNDIFCFR